MCHYACGLEEVWAQVKLMTLVFPSILNPGHFKPTAPNLVLKWVKNGSLDLITQFLCEETKWHLCRGFSRETYVVDKLVDQCCFSEK